MCLFWFLFSYCLVGEFAVYCDCGCCYLGWIIVCWWLLILGVVVFFLMFMFGWLCGLLCFTVYLVSVYCCWFAVLNVWYNSVVWFVMYCMYGCFAVLGICLCFGWISCLFSVLRCLVCYWCSCWIVGSCLMVLLCTFILVCDLLIVCFGFVWVFWCCCLWCFVFDLLATLNVVYFDMLLWGC